ncbi:nibrin [Drosophila ficusphila]|uniref:nibrin n=1 Tax=Drosophila ficusphila TaxID=30025 RepID=UPI0007E67FF7|nr:nibrin [Drosophila ficusphila]
MFVLTKDDEKFVLLPTKNVYTVGRQSTDLIVSQDLSISRNHVQFHLAKEDDEDILQMEDLGSRYGTFIFPRNSQKPRKVAAKTITQLQVGIRVRFGANTSIWQVSQLELITAVSALTRPEIQELEEMLRPMGGTVSPNYTDECTHLTMNEASVTVKLLHALLENKPIVTFAYWRKMLHSAQSIHVKEGWPQPEDYQPSNMDVTWRPERTRLFAGKTFVFMNRKHFEMYGSVVQKAGAACKDLASGVRKTFLTKNDVIVIQYVPSTQSQATESINSIQEILEQSGRRVIQEYEIGMALLHCSIKEFCNPAHMLINESLPSTESVTSSMVFNSSIIVPNTERHSAQSSGSAISELVVPESDASSMQEVSSKPATEALKSYLRKRSHSLIDSSDEEQEAALKRAKPVPQAKPKRNEENAILVDSSDEEEAAAPIKPVTRRSKAIEDEEEADKPTSSKRMTRQSKATSEQEAVKPPVPIPDQNKRTSKRVKPIYFVDSSDEESENSVKAKETADRSEKRKKLEAPAVVRTSPRLNTKPVATNITNQQPETTSRSTSQKQTEPKSAGKPLERISVINFLEKSQSHESASKSQLLSQSQTQPQKRLRLQPLNESDSDDNENVFNFASSKKKKHNENKDNHEDSTDGLFNFNSEKASDPVDQDSVLTEPFQPDSEAKTKSKYVVVQRKEMPKKVDVSGWLSCSRLHDTIEPEIKTEDKLENSIKADPDEEKWLAAMKDSIQVRMCNLTIIKRSQEEVDASINISVSKYSGRKNFKTFVKTNNPHPQRRIVGLKSMQLVDGMVTCL